MNNICFTFVDPSHRSFRWNSDQKFERWNENELNSFLTNVPMLYPMKTPENVWFSSVFCGHEMGIFARNRSWSCSSVPLQAFILKEVDSQFFFSPYSMRQNLFCLHCRVT